MADPLMLADSRPSLIAPASGALELVGRSAIIGRVQEIVRRSALLESGVLIVGERGADAESVARELHARSRPAASWIPVECGTGDVARVERALFGAPPGPP